MADDCLTVLCVQKRAENTDFVIEGSKEARCSICEAPVWLTPATASQVLGFYEKEPLINVALVCLESCAMRRLGHQSDVTMIPLSLEQRKEIAAHMAERN